MGRTNAHARASKTFAALTALAVTLAISLVAVGGPAMADGTPNIGISVSTPGGVPHGDGIPVTLTASNPDGSPWGYNLSFRAVLPPGASYAGGSPVAPTVLTNAPATGQTTLIFSNVADLAPSSSYSLDYTVSYASPGSNPAADCSPSPTDNVFCVGESLSVSAGAYLNDDPRYAPDFNSSGQPVSGTTSYTGWATGSSETILLPFELSKGVAGPQTAESELLRGVHDFPTAYTLEIQNNPVAATNAFTVDDYLPAGTEFLGCGGVDNTGIDGGEAGTNPGSTLEYPGAAALTGTPSPIGGAYVTDPDAICLNPAVVETVSFGTDPDGAGPLEADVVYTHLRWTADQVGSLAAGERTVLAYMTGIPIRENAVSFGTAAPDTAGQQTANLANNTGDETVDEQALTNYATASGTYAGPTEAPNTTFTDTASFTASAEDLSIHKSGSTDVIYQGSIVEWTLLIESSEYRYVTDIVATDTLPNGLCPLDEITDYDTTNDDPNGVLPGDECDGALLPGDQSPSLEYSNTLGPATFENTDGTWDIVWDNVPDLGPSDSTTISFFTQVREYYQASGADDTPVVGADAWSNQADVEGADYRICGDGDPLCGGVSPVAIDGDEADGGLDLDSSTVRQDAAFVTISKLISEPVAEPGILDCAAATWLDDTDPEYPPSVKPGDRVCYRLTVNYPPGVDYRNSTVTDFLPANSSYEAGSAYALGTNTATIVAGDPVVTGTDKLDWRIGKDLAGGACDPASEDCYVITGGSGLVFDVAFSAIVDADPSASTATDIIDNLMKHAGSNTAGQLFNERDQIAYEVAKPLLALTLTATPPTTGLIATDTVLYTVTVTNNGNATAYDPEIWDILPPELVCADITAYGPLPDPGDTVTCNAVPSPDRIEWAIAGPLAPGASTSFTFTATLPDETTDHPVAAGDTLTTTAGVRTYNSHGNVTAGADPIAYYPSSNIDPTVTPNTGPAHDHESVTIAQTIVTKDQATVTTQAGNVDLVPPTSIDQATIGETVTRTITGTIRAGTSLYSATLGDNPSTRLTYVPDSATVTFPDATTWREDGTGDPMPPGFTWAPGTTRLSFPAQYDNPDGSGDDTFTITYEAILDDEPANTRTSSTISSPASLTTNDVNGSAVPARNSSNTALQVVEPLVSVVKTNDAAPEISGGDVVHYTLVVSNSSASRVSTANDLTVLDTIPAGLTATSPTNITGGGVAAVGPPRTITWTMTSLDPGASVTFEYDVTVDNSVIADQTYTNDVDVTYDSLPAPGPDDSAQRSYTSSDSSDVKAASPIGVKNVSPDPRTIGEATSYTLDVTIPANVLVFDATIIDDLPDGLTFDGYGTTSCVQNGGSCAGVSISTLSPQADTPTAGRTRLGWFLGDVGSQPEARVITVVYDAYVDPTTTAGDVTAGDALVNDATLAWNASDAIATPSASFGPDDYDIVLASVNAPLTIAEPALTVDKDVVGQTGDDDTLVVDVDDVVEYSVTVTNATGATVSDAHDLTVVDTIDPAMFVNTGTITGGGTYDGGSHAITWVVAGPIAPGGSVSFSYTAEVDVSSGFDSTTRLPNTADITEYFGVSSANRAAEPGRSYRTYDGPTDTVELDPDAPGLSVDKSSTGVPVIGQPFTWTIVVTNATQVADSRGIAISDVLPANWSYTGPAALTTPSGGPTPITPDTTSPLVFSGLGDLAAGESLTLTFDAKPAYAARGNADQENSATATADDDDENSGNGDGPYTDTDTDDPGLAAATLGNRVWTDSNGNGIQDGGELGIGGVDVTLTWGGLDGDLDAPGDNVVVGTIATGASGDYLFTDLPPGDFELAVATPAGHEPTPADQGGDDAVDSDFEPGTGITRVTLGATTTDLTRDAGFYVPADLGDRVFEDVDGDGQDGSEPGVEDVTVTLTGAGPDGTFGNGDDPAPETTTTDGTGAYLFENLPPGDYVVTFDTTTAAGGTWDFTVPNTGFDTSDSDAVPDSGTPTTGVTGTVSLTSGADDLTIDAGVYIGAAIGDTVWLDLDADGVQDSGEPGLPGVTVELFDLGGDRAWGGGDDTSVGTQATGAEGGYLFVALPPSTYAVAVTVPPGYVISPADAGGDDALDSDINQGTGWSAPTTLDSDETDRTHDAGLVGNGSLGNLVWEDLDGDGAIDPGEPGLPGADVTLTWAGPDGDLGTSADNVVFGTVTTDPDGEYLVEDLPPGAYRVAVVAPPGGYVATGDPDGTGTPSTAITTLDPNEEDEEMDFGYQLQADLVLVKSVDDDDLLSGETAVFRLVVGNDGPAAAVAPIVVTDSLPMGLTPTSASGTGWVCDPIAGQIVTCTYAGAPASLASGDTLPEIVVEALVDGDAGPSLVNSATVASPTVDPDPADSTDTSTVTATHAADLVIDKAHATSDFVVGTAVDYTILVGNEGPSATVGSIADPVRVTDTLPAGLVPTGADGTGWTCSVSGQNVTCDYVGTIAATATFPLIIIDVEVTPPAGDTDLTVTNTATVTPGETIDPDLSNNSDDDPATVVPVVDLALEKTLDSRLDSKRRATWVLAVSNAGPSVAQDVRVTDVLPAGLTYVSATGSGWTCSAAGATVTCLFDGAIAVGETATIRLTTTVVAVAGSSLTNSASATSVAGLEAHVDDNEGSASGEVAVAPSWLPVSGVRAWVLVAAAALFVLTGGVLLLASRRRWLA